MVYLNGIKTTFIDFPNDEDLAIIVFFEGCSHKCKGCQNPQLKDQVHGYSKEDIIDIIVSKCKRHKTTKIVFSGGDPFYPSNKDNLNDMLEIISYLESNGYTLCVYTGFLVDDVLTIYNDRLDLVKPSFLKCGKFVEEHRRLSDKTDDVLVLASPNQNFYKKADKGYDKISSEGVLYF